MNLWSLKGKTAIVTGGGRGLGRAIALEFASAGANVVVAARSWNEISQVAEEIQNVGAKGLAIKTDVTSEEEVQKMVEYTLNEFGGIDILVNNAGTSIVKPIVEMSTAEWHQVINTNLTSAFLCCRTVGPYMIKQRSGKVINVASIAGLRGGPGVYIAYSTSKAGLINFTRALAVEWARYNIQVNAIAPGRFDTEMSKEVLENPETLQRILRKIPLRRIGRPDEVGPLALYLASDVSDYVTGEVIVIDGGAMVKG